MAYQNFPSFSSKNELVKASIKANSIFTPSLIVFKAYIPTLIPNHVFIPVLFLPNIYTNWNQKEL